MKHQIVFIHGGRTFKTYQEYVDSLKHREVTIDTFEVQREWWKDSLPTELGKDFEVFVPKMPNGNNAVYQEWKIWFERMLPFLQEEVVLMGHSLGGIFLTKYLAENIFPKKIQAVVLLAAPFDAEKLDEPLGDFSLPASLEKFSHQVKHIYLLFSKDDPVVPFIQLEKYKRALPNSHVMIFTDRQHFRQESFVEIMELLNKLCK